MFGFSATVASSNPKLRVMHSLVYVSAQGSDDCREREDCPVDAEEYWAEDSQRCLWYAMGLSYIAKRESAQLRN